MKFKTNHSPGPWSFDCHDIRDADGHYIIDTDDVQNIFDVKAITQIPAMLEYMMDRAKKLSEEISYGDSVADHFELIGYMEPEKREELQTILAILKDAGVEVVE